MSLNAQWVRAWIEGCTRVLQENQNKLQGLDTVIGDGDHGVNLARGFVAAEQKIFGREGDSPKRLLRLVANTLLAVVGGASGPLYGTAFLRAARSLSDGEINPQETAMMLVKAAEGIAQRGGAQAGDKTMLDAWLGAAAGAAEAFSGGADCPDILLAAANSAAEAAEATVSMTATKGRAALLGGQSIGHEDPGACSTALVLRAAAQAAELN